MNPTPEATYFHGGAPGLRRRRPLRAAADLNTTYTYTVPTAVYRPDRIYVTTHRELARAYAGRYVDRQGRSVPGSVYQVRVIGTPEPDPDYDQLGHIYLMCRAADIVEVLENDVSLTRREQLQLEAPFMFWGTLPMYTADGYMLPSVQMSSHGATADYLRLLGPWCPSEAITGKGQAKFPPPMQTPEARMRAWIDVIVETFPALDRDHLIAAAGGSDGRSRYECQCAATFDNRQDAAAHQIGLDNLRLILKMHNFHSGHLAMFGKSFQRRSPDRWSWYVRHQ